MRRQLTAIVKREGNGYVALCPEVDVASQGDSVAEAPGRISRKRWPCSSRQLPTRKLRGRLRGEVYVARVEVAGG